MTLSKGAIGNLINRYRAVLKKCRMMNVFGSLAVAGLLVAGSAGSAGAEDPEELSGAISPITVTEGVKSFHGGEDVTLTPEVSPPPYAVKVLGGGSMSLVMDAGKTFTVENAYLGNSGSSAIVYGGTAALRAAGTGSTAIFSGIGNFKATGGGKNFGTSAILSEGGADLTLIGDITGEAVAELNGSEGYDSYGAAALNGGKLTFQGERTFLKASSHTQKNAIGALVTLGGALRFESRSVTLEAINADGGTTGVEGNDGTLETGENTALSIHVEGGNGATGIGNRQSTLLHIGGTLDIAAKQTGETFAAVGGINSDSGEIVADGAVSIKVEAQSGPATGISVSGDATIALKDDVDIDVRGEKASSNGVYTTYATKRAPDGVQKAATPTVVLGNDQRTVVVNSSKNGVAHEGGTLTFAGKTAISAGVTGVAVTGGNTPDAFASLRFEGPVTIDAPTAISTHSGSAQNTAGTVTFAYNSTPINVPVTREQADSQVNGSITGSSGVINKEGEGSLALNGDNTAFMGTFNQKAGWTFLGEGQSGYFSKGKVFVSGGTLVAPTLSFEPKKGTLTLNGGTLVTGTGQIFNTALNAQGNNTETGGVKGSVATGMEFSSGLISFNDAKYNLEYAAKAAENLESAYPETGDATKEITFTGTLVPLPIDSTERLRRALKDTSLDVIKLDADIELVSRLQEATPVTRPVSIDGAGHTLSGPHPAFWFVGMDSGTVSIANITFDGLKGSQDDFYDDKESKGDPGGSSIYFNMVDWRSTAQLNIGDGVVFKNNFSEYDSSAGAVRTVHGSVRIGDNVSFLNNKGGAGGGLYSESFTTIGDNAVFEGNEARRGGAIDVIDDYEGYADDPDYLNGTRKVKYVHIGKNALFKDNKAAFWGTNGNGGAIEVQSGELSIDDGAVFTGNTSDGTGGAISICDWSPQLPGKADLGQASFIGNEATYGGAIFNEGDLSLNGAVSFEGNKAKSAAAALYNTGTATFAAESAFSENAAANGGAILNEGEASFKAKADFAGNTATGAGGAVYSVGSTSFEADATFSNNVAAAGGAIMNEGDVAFAGAADFTGNTADMGGGAVYNTKALTFADGAVFKDNVTSGDGGAIYNDAAASEGTIVSTGDIRFNGGASFTGNRAEGLGGALYNLYDVTLNPGAGQEILFRDNTDATGANAVHMAADSHLDVTGAGAVTFDDPLSFADASPTVKKSGEGDLRFNAAMDGFLGTFEQEDGLTKVASEWNIKNAVTLRGGTLELPSFSFAAPDADGKVAGGKLTIAGGTLVTATGQIFETPLNAVGDNEDIGGVKAEVEEHMDFASGLIAFNDAKYNLQYAGSAAEALGASYGEDPGQTAQKEITFTGELYTGAPDPGPDPDPDPDPGPTPDPDPDPTPDPDPDPDPGPNPDPEPDPGPRPDPQPEPEPTPGPAGTVTTEDLNANNITNVVLGNVTITTDTDPAAGKNLIVGSDVVDDQRFSDAEALPGSIGSRDINLGAEGSGVAVVGGHYLTLVGGEADTSLVSAGSDGEKPVDVLVGGVVQGKPSEGTLNLGTQAMPSGGTLKGNVQLAASSTLNVRAGDFTLTGESATADHPGVGVANGGGTINVGDGATLHASIRQAAGETHVAGRLESDAVELEDGKLTVSGTADIRRLAQHGGETEVSGTLESAAVEAHDGVLRVIGTLKADSLDAASPLRIEVGNGDAAGKLHVASALLDGGSLFLDPVWKGNDTLKEASHGVVTFRNQTVDGRLAAGRNSLLVLGDASADWTLGVFDASGLRWGPEGVTAALAVRAPQRLDPAKGALAVDGSLDTAPSLTPNTVLFGDRSLFVVDASGLKGGAALTAEGGTLTVADTASLLLGNVTAGEYVITSGFTDNAGVHGWEGDFLSSPDLLIALALDKGEAGTVKVRATALDAGDVLPGLALRNTVNEIWGAGRNDVNSPTMGIRFLSRAVNADYLNRGAAVDTIDGAAQIAVAGGVQGTALSAASAPVRAVQDHASLLRSVARKGGDVRGEGINLWIDALYGANRARNLGAGSLEGGYNADFGGVAFGGDVGAGPFRVGMALNAGGGTARSRGDFASTKNDFDFWGVTLYGMWTRNCLNLVADAGYSEGSHEVRQDLPASLRLGQLKADVDTRVVTAGLRAEYLIPLAWADVMPHIGARYTALTTDGFSSRIEDGDVFHISRDTQNVWTFPVGVTFSKDVPTESGWKVKPRADLSVVPAAGDTRARTRAQVSGVAASDAVRSRIVDPVAFDGSVGLELEKDNISLSLNCGVQASEHQTGQNVALSFTYKF